MSSNGTNPPDESNPPTEPNKYRGLTPFKKGDERARGPAKAYDHMRKRARFYTDLALETLVGIMTDGGNAAARVNAAKEILDRGWGKPHIIAEHKEQPQLTQIKVSFGENKEPISVESNQATYITHEATYEDADTDAEAADTDAEAADEIDVEIATDGEDS